MLIFLSVILLILLLSSDAPAQAPYYQGKTVTVIVGSGASTAYDMYARLLANYIGKYLPGNPNVIVQNMPAAGGIVAANYVYGVAKPDGLTVASINPAHYFNQLQGNKEIKFDWTKFTWLASSDKSEHMLYMRTDAPYKSMQDIRKATEPPKCGATGTGTSGHYIPRMLEEALGTKFTIVTGYAGGNEIDLATERNEVVCRSFTTAAYFGARAVPHLAQEKFCADSHANRPQARSALAGDTAIERPDGRSQNLRSWPARRHGHARFRRAGPADRRASGNAAGKNQSCCARRL